MSFRLPNLGKKLSEIEGSVGNFFAGAAQGLGNVANQTSRTVGGFVNQLPVISDAEKFALRASTPEFQRQPLGQQIGQFIGGIGDVGYRNSPLGSAERLGANIASTVTQRPVISAQGATLPVNTQIGQQQGLLNKGLVTAGILGDAAFAASPLKVGAPVVKPTVSLIKNAYQKSQLANENGYIGQPRLGGQFATGNKIHPEDAQVMTNFIDHARGITKLPDNQARQLELDASRVAEHYNIGKSGQSMGNLASAFDKRIQTTPSLLDRIKAPLQNEGGYLKLPGTSERKPRVQLAKSEQNLPGSSLPKSIARPTHQVEIEAASNKGDMAEVARLIKSMPDSDPYKKSMQSLFAGRLPKEVTQLPVSGVKKVGLVDKAFRSTRSIIERQGEHGKQLAGMLQGARDTEELYSAALQKGLPTARSLKGKDFENFVEATQGKVTPSSTKVAQAVSEWQSVAPQIRDRAVQAGLDVGDLGPNYYPHIIDFEKVFKDRNKYNEAINHLVETGQAKDVQEAIKNLSYARDVSRNRTFGNLEASRLVDLPMYDKTPNSLSQYLQGSTRRTAQAETFGPKDEKSLELIAKAGAQGKDAEAMKNAYDIAVGARKYNPEAQKVSGNIRKYMTTTRLGLGAITNASQSVNTGIVTGHLRTLGSMIKQLSPKERQYTFDTGVISDAVLNDIKEQAGFTGKALSKITAPGFNAVEKFNRSVAATSGRDYALRLAQKGDESTLRKLGVTGKIEGRTLTRDQQIQASRKIVEKTQFKVDPQDLPGWASSPGGKLVSQFRTFSYNQSKFFNNEILQPMRKGNYQPFARLLAALPVGYGLYETKRAIAGRPEETNKPRVALESFANVGGAGLVMDVFRGMVPLNGKYLPPDRRISMALNTFGGPTAGAAADLIGGVSEAVQRKNVPEAGVEGKVAIGNNGEQYTDLTPLSRTGLRQIPIIGTAIQNRVLPYNKPVTPATEVLPGANAAEGPLPVKPNTQGLPTVNNGSILTGDNTTPEAKAAAKLKRDTRKAEVKTGARLGGTEELDKAQTRIDSATKTLNPGLPEDQQKLIIRHAKLNENGKAKFEADPKNNYKLKVAQYENNKLNGKFDSTSDFKARESLAKLSITSNYSQEVSEFYGMSKENMRQFIAQNPEKGQKLFSEALKLDQELVKKYGADSKFKYGLGSKPARGTTGSPYKYAISANAGGEIKRPKVSIAKMAKPKTSRARSQAGARPTVSIRKSKV